MSTADDRPGDVLVVGAAGFLGRAIVHALVVRGHRVRGLVRSEEGEASVRSAGGSAVRGDVLDASSLLRASARCGAIVHVAANPSQASNDPALPERVRVEGACNLVEAAKANDVRRLVIGSGYWVYRGQSDILTESSPVDPQGEARFNYGAERVGLVANAPGGLEVMVVRPGMVYGDGSWFRPIVRSIREGTYHLIEGGTNRWSFVSLDDAGIGFSTVVESGRAGEVYNLVDGSPASWGEFARHVARRLGRPEPGSISLGLAHSEYGPVVADHLAADRAATSQKIRALGWVPQYARYAPGIDVLIERMSADSVTSRA